ncbi:3-phosphoshikimate 1-carboxyvinyltransferase [Paenalcaligenes hominis]|uniref:3-phosphoshikimate 1-carboxyvinyltransferase n=3 Tax=Paenalcaligenes hominis TaxID=643674 RepID=A0ABX0WL38_9BURK|nr:3-phosphoshikimate 1-carboxyvinyltransferase [Paenalcaligenes hominis]NJB63955.1 3-phosphoshikimate 1-carboxyvinyltransferase [Paenalcaligenes hominis]GGE61918.1 3-phosphoshikimate 1-carboxyvinyltransferase [Paenalcaligenes hominis]
MSLEQITLEPATHASGTVHLPGSKSISNRALLLAALTPGITSLTGVLASDDTRVMIDALNQLGVEAIKVSESVYQIHGGTPFNHAHADLFLGNAGTAFRSLTAALAFLGGDYTLSGIPRMHERPIGDLVEALQGAGARIDYLETSGYPPLKIGQPTIDLSQPIRVKGSVSSQFLTALLMAAPIAVAQTQTELVIEVEGTLISQPYIAITLDMMEKFGVLVRHDEHWQRFVIQSDAQYVSPGEFHVEGDASSASYFLALGTIAGGPIDIQGVGALSVQGDVQFAKVMEYMGAQVTYLANSMEVTGVNVAQGQRLKAFDLDFNLIPDAAMTAAALAVYADGPCTLRNIASWRVKETDRIDAMQNELRQVGAEVESGPDWITIYPIPEGGWRSARIETYDDHRMAMCLSLMRFGGMSQTILDPNCVSKTFPEYFSIFEQLIKG